MSTYRNICLIPAKGASTRLQMKNLLKINGKELIYYPIQAARDAQLYDDSIYVSTELVEIGDIATKHGAKVHNRDPKLAVDPYGVKDVAIEFLEKHNFISNTTLTILLPTTPLLSVTDIVKAHQVYERMNYKYLFSIVETDHNARRSVELNEEGEMQPIFPDCIEKKSQELFPTYRINGAIVIVDAEDLLKTRKYFNEHMGAYVMPRERSIDIDTEFDYKLAKFLLESQE